MRQRAQPRSHRVPRGQRRETTGTAGTGAHRPGRRRLTIAGGRQGAPGGGRRLVAAGKQRLALAAFGVAALGMAAAVGFVACSRASSGSAAGLRALADRLQRGDEATYTAEYGVGGSTVVHVHAPPRQAFRSSGVTLTIGPDTIVTCTDAATSPSATSVIRCERSPGVDGMALTEARMVTKATTTGFVAPDLAASVLLRAAARPDLRVTTRRRTLGGTQADCATVDAAAVQPPAATVPLTALRFTACVTTAGVLAGFEGTTEGAGTGRMTLERYLPRVSQDAFDLPRGATVADAEGT